MKPSNKTQTKPAPTLPFPPKTKSFLFMLLCLHSWYIHQSYMLICYFSHLQLFCENQWFECGFSKISCSGISSEMFGQLFMFAVHQRFLYMFLVGKKKPKHTEKNIYIDYYFKEEWTGYCTAITILHIMVLISLIYSMLKQLGCYLSLLAHSVLNWKRCTEVLQLQNVE